MNYEYYYRSLEDEISKINAEMETLECALVAIKDVFKARPEDKYLIEVIEELNNSLDNLEAERDQVQSDYNQLAYQETCEHHELDGIGYIA